MVVPVCPYGHEAYSGTAQLAVAGTELDGLIQNLWDTIKVCKLPYLTARHIGNSVQVAVIDTSLTMHWRDDVAADGDLFREAIINPEILETNGLLATMLEFDASLPALSSSLERVGATKAKWHTVDGKVEERWLTGRAARAFLNCVDMMEGKHFIDHLNPHRRRSVNGHVKRVSNGKVKASYAMVESIKDTKDPR